jgi:hypothetical protein
MASSAHDRSPAAKALARLTDGDPMANRSSSDRTCSHLPRSYFSNLGDQLWCVRCDGSVTADGAVIPRGSVEITPPVSPNYGAKLERIFGREIRLRRRSAPDGD